MRKTLIAFVAVIGLVAGSALPALATHTPGEPPDGQSCGRAFGERVVDAVPFDQSGNPGDSHGFAGASNC